MVSASRRRPARNLPVDLTSFVGRRHELAEAKRLLSSTRCLTLTGAGGVGKTRLALRLGADVQRAFADGVCVVELASLADPELVEETVAATLGVRESSAQDAPHTGAVEALSQYLRDKHLLLVLDNCEHVLDACAELADILLQTAPKLRILATSRQPLGIGGESIMRVPSLSLPDPDAPLPPEAITEYEAVALFLQRAVAVSPEFTLDGENAVAVARLCRRLDGIPLCIELAAARLRVLSVDEILARLDDVFRLLASGSRSALPRQQTLWASIDWSFHLCTAEEQNLWARASVFTGGFELEAAEEVCSGDGLDRYEVLDLVAGLVDKSVLICDGHGSRVRYRMLETIRQYGREKLAESGPLEAVARRHRDWYSRLAARVRTEWFGPRQVEWFGRLSLDHPNIRAALEFCLGDPGGAETGLRIAADLRYYWIAKGILSEGRRWFTRLLDQHREPTAARGNALVVAARLAVLQSDWPAAETLLDEGQELARELGDPAIFAQEKYVSGLTALFQDDLSTAADRLAEARAAFGAAADQGGVVNSSIHLATALSRLERRDEAVTLYEECLELAGTRDESWFRSWALWALGIEVFRQGDRKRAIASQRESIQLKGPFQDQLGIALGMEALAWTAVDDNPRQAARLLGAAGALFAEIGASLFEHLKRHHDECETAARRALGRTAFESAFQEGADLSFRQAIEYALDERADTAVPEAAPVSSLAALTRREREIAELVAQGLTNKEIAAKLVISQRTAESHVEHILSKLAFTSRTQIAAWVTERKSPASAVPETASRRSGGTV